MAPGGMCAGCRGLGCAGEHAAAARTMMRTRCLNVPAHAGWSFCGGTEGVCRHT